MNTDWKYTPLTGKKPIVKDWPIHGMTLAQATSYPGSTGVGLILGEHSNGVMALDMDGPLAWEFFDTEFEDRGLLDSSNVIWSSGIEYRCQFAWSVPQECWSYIKTIKVGPSKKMEFRWTGGQSVLPPSIHPDTKKPYEWIRTGQLTEIPIQLLEFWMLQPHSETAQFVNSASSLLYADMRVMDSIIRNFHLMQPGNRDTYFCKIWGILSHNRFSVRQKGQIMQWMKTYDADMIRQKSLAKKLRER